MQRTSLMLFLVVATGCATHIDRLEVVRSAYFHGDVALAKVKIDEYAKKHKGEADVFELDRAMILLSEGKPAEAEKILRKVRDRFDFLEQKDVAEGVASMLTDDQRLSYHGEDYEKVLIRAMLALTSLVGDGQDANAYALQVAEKQEQIIAHGKAVDGKNPKENYKQVAIGPYVRAAVREETQTNYDDAERALQLVCNWEPTFTSGVKELERVRTGRHSEKGNGVVYVFTLVGKGPYKEERMEVASTVSLLVADRILSIAGKRSVPPTIAPIKVPRVVRPVNAVQTVQVVVDGHPLGQTETITDVGRIAFEQDEANFPYTLGRAVARRVVKKGIIYGAKEVTKMQKGSWTNLALDATGVVWEATESADTRCWGLLPEKIQVLRLELPAGLHQLALQPTSADRSFRGSIEMVPVQVEEGRNTYVLANFPGSRIAGRIVTNHEMGSVAQVKEENTTQVPTLPPPRPLPDLGSQPTNPGSE